MEVPDSNPYVEPGFEPPETAGLKRDEAEREVELLREAVEYHDHLYYVEANPVISDEAYDELLQALQKIEREHDLVEPTSPTQRVGGEPVDEFESREHVVEMLSLDSSEDQDELHRWHERVQREVDEPLYQLEPKFDGVSLELVYTEGELEAAVTRGDGVTGDDVTANARTIRSIPLRLPEQVDVAVRAEVYIPKPEFHALNRERLERGEDAFANPRNAAAGSLRQQDPSVVAERPLDVYVYDVLQTEARLSSQRDATEHLRELGFRVTDEIDHAETVNEITDYRDSLAERREELEYEVDGAVAKLDGYEDREKLGSTSRHPRWAFAYKLPAKTGETIVQDIAVQVGRTGKLTPVALLDPVDIRGVTVSRASLHNQAQARALGVGRGAHVEVERAGDVIPQIESVVEASEDEFTMPARCPVCDSEVVQEGEHHYCTGGLACPAQLRGRLEHYCSRDAMDIEGIGEKLAHTLVETRLVESLPDLYELTADELSEIEGLGPKSAEKLVREIEDSKDVDLPRFLTALGIRHVGPDTARRVAREHDLESLLEASEQDLRKIEGVGPEVARSIRSFLDGAGGQTIQKLLDHGVHPRETETGDELEGQKIAITGRLQDYTRRELTGLLEKHGAQVTSNVSSQTDLLVVGEEPGETKLHDAEQHDTETTDEQGLRDRVLERIR
ncbi:MAG: NAD-dependent DNA ligase LigA [Halobacteriota archaeon]